MARRPVPPPAVDPVDELRAIKRGFSKAQERTYLDLVDTWRFRLGRYRLLTPGQRLELARAVRDDRDPDPAAMERLAQPRDGS